jgi:glycosyltransferase involved in cell wall biosynthesis
VRILHLFANWKWTGPAEPALNVAWRQSREHEVLFVSGSAPEGETSRIVPQAAAREVPVRDGLRLSKHSRPLGNRQDVARLAELLGEFRPDIVHCHLDNDHRIGAAAVARTGIGRLVRTAYDVDGLRCTLRLRLVARRALHGLIVVTRGAEQATRSAWGGEPGQLRVDGRVVPMELIEGGVDLARFDAARFDRAAARARLGLRPEHVAVGIVARVQGHRRFEILIEALALLAPRRPELRLVVIGRGTRIDELLLTPVRERGLQGALVAPGYLSGDDYPAALCALDAGLFLVPGSDGTCRALRELLACGLACVVSQRPPLPEIVEQDVSGLVVEESASGLVQGIERLLADAPLRDRLRQGARAAAVQRFELAHQADAVTGFYDRLLAAR